eukprot:8569290-Pyramimonas_sp.AAC.1
MFRASLGALLGRSREPRLLPIERLYAPLGAPLGGRPSKTKKWKTDNIDLLKTSNGHGHLGGFLVCMRPHLRPSWALQRPAENSRPGPGKGGQGGGVTEEGKPYARRAREILPKHHYFDEQLDATLSSRENPSKQMCLTGEDFLGKIKRIEKSCSKASANGRMLQRYSLFIQNRWAKRAAAGARRRTHKGILKVKER